MSENNRNINVGAVREIAAHSPVEAQKQRGLEGKETLSERMGVGSSMLRRVVLPVAACVLAGWLSVGCSKSSGSEKFDGGYDSGAQTDSGVDVWDRDSGTDVDADADAQGAPLRSRAPRRCRARERC